MTPPPQYDASTFSINNNRITLQKPLRYAFLSVINIRLVDIWEESRRTASMR
ncbi:MAG: hypothetical protein HOL72_06295 [Euryarchaeota archaeon]|nr:hypothetical protein [Euryarchaeota archaeon]